MLKRHNEFKQTMPLSYTPIHGQDTAIHGQDTAYPRPQQPKSLDLFLCFRIPASGLLKFLPFLYISRWPAYSTAGGRPYSCKPVAGLTRPVSGLLKFVYLLPVSGLLNSRRPAVVNRSPVLQDRLPVHSNLCIYCRSPAASMHKP